MSEEDDERGLFDHLEEVKTGKDPNYWEKLSDSERKKWSTFMIERFLSSNPNFTSIISELKPYTYQMEDRHVYRLYAEILPYDNEYWEYISNKNKERYPDWIVERISEHYEVSTKEGREYLDIFLSKDAGRKKLKTILRKYGLDQSKIDRVDNLKKQ